MNFLKKVLVLKPTDFGFNEKRKSLGGIARLESENGICELHLSLINFPVISDGKYQAFLFSNKSNLICFDLGLSPSSLSTIVPTSFDLSARVSFGIVTIKNDLPLTLAFACDDNSPSSLATFNKAVAERVLEQKKNKLPEKKEQESEIRPPYPPAPNPDPQKEPDIEFPDKHAKDKYDDEAVATVNYYDFDDDIKYKLDKIKEVEYASTRLEDELSYFRGEEKAQKGKADARVLENETDFSARKKYSEKSPFYSTVKSELNEIFKKFPRERDLESALPFSRWAKVPYSDDKFYVVGLIKEKGKPRYVCYGVPDTYSSTPPKDLKGKCTFIPLSVFNVHGDGYWVMFQDAITGERIDLKE